MDQFSRTTSSNDLQKAIDEISGEGIAPTENNSKVNLGEPPVPPMDDFGMPPMDGAKVTPPEPATDLDRMMNPAAAATPAVKAPEIHGETSDLGMVRETALKELVPIIDKAGLSADRQFGIIAAVIESSHDKSFIPKALEAARGIADEKQRAEALLKLVSMIDS